MAHGLHSLTRLGCAALAVIVLPVHPAHAEPTSVTEADGAAPAPAQRGSAAHAWAGGGVLVGDLRFRAPGARVEAVVRALPAVVIGFELWPETTVGLYANVAIGAGARLDLPDGRRLAYNAHRAELGTRFRWRLGEGANALRAMAGLGGRALIETAQVQRPALLVDRTIAGPEVSVGLEWPALGERLVLRLLGWGGAPFFVRESPADSGDLQEMWSLGAQASARVELTQRWGVLLAADLNRQSLRFAGEGTRAAGVNDAQTTDQYLSGTLAVTWAF